MDLDEAALRPAKAVAGLSGIQGQNTASQRAGGKPKPHTGLSPREPGGVHVSQKKAEPLVPAKKTTVNSIPSKLETILYKGDREARGFGSQALRFAPGAAAGGPKSDDGPGPGSYTISGNCPASDGKSGVPGGGMSFGALCASESWGKRGTGGFASVSKRFGAGAGGGAMRGCPGPGQYDHSNNLAHLEPKQFSKFPCSGNFAPSKKDFDAAKGQALLGGSMKAAPVKRSAPRSATRPAAATVLNQAPQTQMGTAAFGDDTNASMSTAANKSTDHGHGHGSGAARSTDYATSVAAMAAIVHAQTKGMVEGGGTSNFVPKTFGPGPAQYNVSAKSMMDHLAQARNAGRGGTSSFTDHSKRAFGADVPDKPGEPAKGSASSGKADPGAYTLVKDFAPPPNVYNDKSIVTGNFQARSEKRFVSVCREINLRNPDGQNPSKEDGAASGNTRQRASRQGARSSRQGARPLSPSGFGDHRNPLPTADPKGEAGFVKPLQGGQAKIEPPMYDVRDLSEKLSTGHGPLGFTSIGVAGSAAFAPGAERVSFGKGVGQGPAPGAYDPQRAFDSNTLSTCTAGPRGVTGFRDKADRFQSAGGMNAGKKKRAPGPAYYEVPAASKVESKKDFHLNLKGSWV